MSRARRQEPREPAALDRPRRARRRRAASSSRRGCSLLPAAGRALPPHVTALWPFLPVEALDAAVERRLEELLAGAPAVPVRAHARRRASPTPSSSCPSRPSRSPRSRGCCGTSGRSARRSAAPSTTSRRTSWWRSTRPPADRAADRGGARAAPAARGPRRRGAPRRGDRRAARCASGGASRSAPEAPRPPPAPRSADAAG